MTTRRLAVLVALSLSVAASAPPRAQVLVGNGKTDLGGDGGLATRAGASAVGIAVDSMGNIYLGGGTRIRRIDRATGIIDTIAGDHNDPYAFHGGFSGDGGPATAADFKSTGAIALRGDGELLVADGENGRVRRIDLKTGIVTTIAGGGTGGPYGTEIGDGSLATEVRLWPEALTVDAEGNLFLAGRFLRIRRVDRKTGIISTVAGSGKKGFSGDDGPATDAAFHSVIAMAFGPDGGLYLSDGGNHCIRKVDLQSGVVSRVAGTGAQGDGGDGGPALLSQLNFPAGVAFNREGDLFIADTGNNRLRRVDHRTREISTIAQVQMACFAIACFSIPGRAAPERAGFTRVGLASTSALQNSCQGITGIAVDGAGAVLVSDAPGIVRVDPAGGRKTVAGGGDPRWDARPARQTSLWRPEGLALNAEGDLFIADTGHRLLRRLDHSTHEVASVRVLSDPAVVASQTPNVKLFEEPSSLAFDTAGTLYVVERARSRVWTIDAAGVIRGLVAGGSSGVAADGGPRPLPGVQPVAVAVDTERNVYLSDGVHNRVWRVDHETRAITTVAGTGAAGFSGDRGRAAEASLHSPRGLAVHASSLYIADTANSRIRRVDLETGTITTLAGAGVSGFSGDGGPAAGARLAAPGAIAVDGDGNLYVADSGNDRIRRIDAKTGIIETVLGPEDGIAYPQGVAVDRSGHLLVSNTAKNTVLQAPGGTPRP